MTPEQVRVGAHYLMQRYGLISQGWSFQFNTNKRTNGLCRYKRKSIELSLYFIEGNQDAAEIRDVVLHEIAHALVGPGHHHDWVWHSKARQIGCSGKRCSQNPNPPPGKYQAKCPGCARVFHWHRRPKQLTGHYCVRCGPDRGRVTIQVMV